jgi:hypothetical protein
VQTGWKRVRCITRRRLGVTVPRCRRRGTRFPRVIAVIVLAAKPGCRDAPVVRKRQKDLSSSQGYNLNPWRNRRRIVAFFSFPLGFLPSVPSTMRLRSASAGTSKHCNTGKLTICWLWQGPSGLKPDQRARVAVREPGERSCPAVCCFGPSNDGAIGAWGLGRGGCDVEPRLRPASSP